MMERGDLAAALWAAQIIADPRQNSRLAPSLVSANIHESVAVSYGRQEVDS